jgi:hypothetical protein
MGACATCRARPLRANAKKWGLRDHCRDGKMPPRQGAARENPAQAAVPRSQPERPPPEHLACASPQPAREASIASGASTPSLACRIMRDRQGFKTAMANTAVPTLATAAMIKTRSQVPVIF